MNDRPTETEKTDRDFGSVWPRTDKSINRSNPPPAYSPESCWPGSPCITKQRDRDTMRQKVRDRETETEKDRQMEAYGETRKAEASFWQCFFHFLPQLPPSTSRTPVRRPVAVRGQSGVSGPTSMLMSPAQLNDVNTMRRTVMEEVIRGKMRMVSIMSQF